MIACIHILKEGSAKYAINSKYHSANYKFPSLCLGLQFFYGLEISTHVYSYPILSSFISEQKYGTICQQHSCLLSQQATQHTSFPLRTTLYIDQFSRTFNVKEGKNLTFLL